MPRLFETVTDLFAERETLERRRFGVIMASDGEVVRVRLRPIPKRVWLPEAVMAALWFHRRERGDRCWLYYNQPRRFPQFLTLQYMVSTRGCRTGTIRRALATLEEIARIKRSDALLCDAWNRRISDRLLTREGWEAHAPTLLHRNYIKRFYGAYPRPLEPETSDERRVEVGAMLGAGFVGDHLVDSFGVNVAG